MSWQEYPRLGERVYRNTLPNGLRLIVVPREGFQKKLAYFVTDYGSVHTQYTLDGENREAPAGVAHFLEHKMFDLPRGEVSAEFAQLGANPNAFTSYDMTAYFFSCTENFEKCLDLLLEFVSVPYFTGESVAKEQGIIGQEIDMTADGPENKVFENLMEAMYGIHPVRVPILGTRETIGRITPQVLYDCHRAFYNPENMLLCVVGDVDAAAVEALTIRRLGTEKHPGGTKCRDWTEPITCLQPEIREAMEVSMPMFQLGFKHEPIPGGEAGMHMEIVAELASEALFGESSPLYQQLYGEGIIDSSFGGGFETLDGMAMLTVTGDSEDPEAVREAILEEADRLLQRGLTEADFLRMKRSAMGRRIRGLDSFDSVCFRLCAYEFTGFDYFEFPKIYESVQRQELLDFIAGTVRRERCCLSVIIPKNQED